ncbi:hypothetical protein Angca_006093, partial [Angiostrongylus cantonensis]
YCQQIAEMHCKLQQQRPAFVNREGPIVHHDNVWPHSVELALRMLMELGYETLPHRSYSSGTSRTDYHF